MPLSSAAVEPEGNWLATSVAVESADRPRAFPGLGLQAALPSDWLAGVRIPFESAAHTTRWSDARRHGQLLAGRRFNLAPQLRGGAAAGATFNSGDVSQHAHFLTGSLVGVRMRYTPSPWSGALGAALQQFEPHRDGSVPGDIWRLEVSAGRYLRLPRGRWFAGVALDGELYLPGADADGADTADGDILLLGTRLQFERSRWRVTGGLQTALQDTLDEGDDELGYRLQLQVSYGLDEVR